jgi:hypothetical protein
VHPKPTFSARLSKIYLKNHLCLELQHGRRKRKLMTTTRKTHVLKDSEVIVPRGIISAISRTMAPVDVIQTIMERAPKECKDATPTKAMSML